MKTNQDHQRIAAAFDRLFRTYPQFGQGSTPDEVTRDRIEKAKVYFEAVSIYAEEDVEAAVDAVLTGTAAGMNPNFAPPAPAFAGEVRRQMNMRLRRDEIDRLSRPRLMAPDIEKTPEQMARGRAMMEEAVATMGGTPNPIDSVAIEAAAKVSKERMAKHDAFFADDFVPVQGGVGKISKSLAKAIGYQVKEPGFTAGDPDGDRDVA